MLTLEEHETLAKYITFVLAKREITREGRKRWTEQSLTQTSHRAYRKLIIVAAVTYVYFLYEDLLYILFLALFTCTISCIRFTVTLLKSKNIFFPLINVKFLKVKDNYLSRDISFFMFVRSLPYGLVQVCRNGR